MSDQQNLEQYRSNLSLIKSMTGDKAEEQFYQLMEKAKNSFGQLSLYMAEFYFQYAKFLLEKMEKNIDIFNAGSLPVGEPAAVAENPIPEDMYEDDSSLQSNSQEQPPKSQNNAVHNKPSQQNPTDPVITQNEPSANKNGHKDPVPQNQNENQVNENQGQDDDYEICAQNLLCAIKIFQNQRDRIKEGGEQGIYSISEVARWISRCKSRLGDLHHLSQNYVEAVNVYREVVEDQEKKFGHESNRGLAQIHYMIANSFLYQNKDGCQRVAIKQFLKSVQILKNHLMMLSPDDNTIYQTPTQEKIKVDRFAYLPRPTDTEQIKQIKEVISCLLDKIQDTHEQISIRAQYEAEKKKTKEEEEQNQFKEVSPNTTVVKLGTFGNRKKKADELPDEELKKKNG